MSATMPVEQARRIFQSAEDTLSDPAPYMDQARDDLIERLISGKKVHGMTGRDVFDSALDASYYNVLDLLANVLALNEQGPEDFRLNAYDCANTAKKLIEQFVDSKPEWIWERACEIANDDSEDE